MQDLTLDLSVSLAFIRPGCSSSGKDIFRDVAARAVTDNINLGAGNDVLNTFGAIDLAGATINLGTGTDTINFNSDVIIRASQLNAAEVLNFVGGQNHNLFVVNDLAVGEALNLSAITLYGTGNLTIDLSNNGTNATVTPTVGTLTSNGTGIVTIGGTPVDTTAPAFVSAAVNGTALTMTYSEALNGAAAPQLGSFAVSVNGVAAPATAVAVGGSTVTLTLGTAVIAGATVTVSYTDPTTGNDALAIQDAAGNDAVSVSNATVTNNTGGGGGGGSITLDVNATTAAAPLSAAGSNVTFAIAQATYTQEITGFAAGDILDFPAGNNPTVNNISYTDSIVDVQFAMGGTTAVIRLTGIDNAIDSQLNGVGDFATVFGAGTII